MYDYNQDENVGGEALEEGVYVGRELHRATKEIVRKRIKRAQVQRQSREAKVAAKETAKATAKAVKKLVELTAKATKTLIEFIIEHPVLVLVIVLVILLFAGIRCFVMQAMDYGFEIMGETVAVSTYTAYDENILGVNSDYTKLEKELQKTISNTERDYPGYDEYEYQLEEIGHNPYELISFLTVQYEDFTRQAMKPVIKEIFDKQYNLTYSSRTETRYRLDENNEWESYTVSILTVKLNNRGLDHVVSNSGIPDVQKQRYQLLLATKGNKAYLFEDIYTQEEIPDEYEVPPDVLTDQSFAAMIAEGEKYLGMEYVWGGSSPRTGFDCSGFVCWVLNHSGWCVGRTDCNGLKKMCTVVSADEAKPGDLIFFKGTQKNKSGATHVGIYCGNGIMLHCGNPIQYTSINGKYYQEHFLCYGRLSEN